MILSYSQKKRLAELRSIPEWHLIQGGQVVDDYRGYEPPEDGLEGRVWVKSRGDIYGH